YTRDPAGGREWLPALPPTIDARHVATSGGVCGVGTTGASAYQAYSATGSCGDGVSQGGEACDPPGRTEQQVCATGSGASGFRVRTCQQSCAWTEPNTTWDGGSPTSPCVTACGNFVPDGAEECDVGPTGGNVPVGHPTSGIVPGISTDTQYRCSAACVWSGGRCGDSIAQPSHGEQCDGAANVATTPTQSSSTTQYACTPVTDANPCKGVGGFCGDGTIQAANAEQCDGGQARSCIGGDGNLRTPAGISGGGTLVDLSLPWRTTGAYSRIRFDNIAIQDQGGANGSIRITLETSNDPGNLANLTRDQIEAAMALGTTINDYNPGGAQGGAGVYHRLRIETKPAGADVSTYVAHGTMWALASNAHQTTSMVIDSMPSGARDLRIVWDNDWSSSSFDSNLMLHRVTLEGQQVRRCHASGADACEWNGGWQACQAAGALCGNGTVDAGEECDDGGKGRCVNELTKVCASNAECTGGACERDLDSCTSECKRNVCGDARQLAPTCTAGNPSDIGKSCTSNAQCGATGLCAVEQCDLGTSNWRAVCTGTTNAERALDVQCVPNAVCQYGRQCNYCVLGSCGVATKQGGFCGDRAKNGPEFCDFIEGTNQCTGLSGTARTNCQAAVGVANLDWSRQICGVACDAT
ncbi:MAG: hypothetical protein Q8R16_04935, partial [bacterium]|nr:hypothetical protein [bacterium]